MKSRICHLVLLSVITTLPQTAWGAPEQTTPRPHIDLPSLQQILRALFLVDYNTRLVVLSTMTLGVAAGLIGAFLLLRKRSLIGDALSHATLPGICAAFMIMVAWGGEGKFLPGLLLGATISGMLGVVAVMLIKATTRLKDDAALGIVLSVFFGIGVAMLGLIQDMPAGSAAGLESFIYGKTASIVQSDLLLIVGVAIAVALACVLFYKEFTLLCFDDGYARSQGWPVTFLDILMLMLVTSVTVIGLQAVGLILVIALLVIPPASARFWTEHLPKMMLGSALIGAISGWFGASLSAVVPRLPAGAVIVIVAAGIFTFSMIFGSSRGVLVRALAHWRLTQNIARQHLLRAIFELTENQPPRSVTFNELLQKRSWSRLQLHRLLKKTEQEGLITLSVDREVKLTEAGLRMAVRMVRNHRLWEIYLITHADIAPSYVDRDADLIEHILGAEMTAKLEKRLGEERQIPSIPPSPHAI